MPHLEFEYYGEKDRYVMVAKDIGINVFVFEFFWTKKLKILDDLTVMYDYSTHQPQSEYFE